MGSRRRPPNPRFPQNDRGPRRPRRPRRPFPRGPKRPRKPIGRGPRRPFRPFTPRDIVRRPPISSCPDPNMTILMADGSYKKAGQLVVGDLVKTYHEKDLEKASKKSLVLASGGAEKYSQIREQLENSYSKVTLGEYKVEFVNIVKNVEKIKLTFEGSEIICSLSHKFYVNDSWKEAKDMFIGDEVSGKELLSIEKVENGDVVLITIEDAHTYICEGLLSHNKRIAPPGSDLAKRMEELRERRKRGEIITKRGDDTPRRPLPGGFFSNPVSDRRRRRRDRRRRRMAGERGMTFGDIFRNELPNRDRGPRL